MPEASDSRASRPAPTAAAGLRIDDHPGLPLTYWFFGSGVRRILQCDRSGTDRCGSGNNPGDPIQAWTDGDSVRHDVVFSDPVPFAEMWPTAKPLPASPVDIYRAGKVLQLLLWESGKLGVRSFDPKTQALQAQPTVHPELQPNKKFDLTVSAACEVADRKVMLFGSTKKLDSACAVWDTYHHRVSKPEKVPGGSSSPAKAAFIGYDTVGKAGVMRLYHGQQESAFTLTFDKNNKPVLSPTTVAVTFLARSWPSS